MLYCLCSPSLIALQLEKPSLPFTDSEIVLSFVGSNPDKYSPFREKAPGRQKALKMACTAVLLAAGFFSLLVFRGIIFATPFLSKRRTIYFADMEAWKEESSPYLKGKSAKKRKERRAKLCNMNAYGGAAVSQRKPENAGTYWECAKKWEEFAKEQKEELSPGCKIPFDKAYDWILENEKEFMPAFGALTYMLLIGMILYSILQGADYLCM